MARNSKKILLASLLFSYLCAAVFGDGYHILQNGETLYSLSRRYGVTVSDLLEANGIDDPSSLSVGMRLEVPGLSPDTPETAKVVMYTVQKGDTYYGIARRHGLVVDQLLEMNSRNSSRVLSVGEELIVAASGENGSAAPRIQGNPPVENKPAAWSGSAEAPVTVSRVPYWPAAGLKRPMDGKLVGVTIETEPRSYIHAISAGSVVWTGPYRGFGNVVLVESKGYIYLYGGSEDLFVNVGQRVQAGSRIGRLADSGPSGGNQEVIFSVFREGIPVSPDEAPRG